MAIQCGISYNAGYQGIISREKEMQTYFPGLVIKGRYGQEYWGLSMITQGYNYEDTIDVGLK